MGTLSLALRSLVDGSSSEPSKDDKTDKSRGGINTVRFGVTTTTTPR
jgi:hypothetical protein